MKKSGKLAFILACLLLTGCGDNENSTSTEVVSTTTTISTTAESLTHTTEEVGTDATVTATSAVNSESSELTAPTTGDNTATETVPFNDYNKLCNIPIDFSKANLSKYSEFVAALSSALSCDTEGVKLRDELVTEVESLSVQRDRSDNITISYYFSYNTFRYNIFTKIDKCGQGIIRLIQEPNGTDSYILAFSGPASFEYYIFGEYITPEWEQKYKGTDVTEDWKIQRNHGAWQLLTELYDTMHDGTLQKALHEFLDVYVEELPMYSDKSRVTNFGILSRDVVMQGARLNTQTFSDYTTIDITGNAGSSVLLRLSSEDIVECYFIVECFDCAAIIEVSSNTPTCSMTLLPLNGTEQEMQELMSTASTQYNSLSECIDALVSYTFG